MKAKKNAPLPPWVDVSGNANKDYWISPALPWMPSSDTNGRDDFSGIVLTALLHKMKGGRKMVEMRLERRMFMLKRDGTATIGAIGQTIAFGVLPLKKFLKATEVAIGRSVSSRIFTFYENDIDVITTSVAGGLPYDAQIVANLCRGYDKPKKFIAGHSYATMTFLFNEGNKSFEKWRKGLECQKR
jgi:hypothetical protein